MHTLLGVACIMCSTAVDAVAATAAAATGTDTADAVAACARATSYDHSIHTRMAPCGCVTSCRTMDRSGRSDSRWGAAALCA